MRQAGFMHYWPAWQRTDLPPTERLRWSPLSRYPGRPLRIQTGKVPSDSRPGEVTIVAEGSRDARYNARRAAVLGRF